MVVDGYNINQQGYSSGAGVARFKCGCALLESVWHASWRWLWRGGRAFERVGEECVRC